MQRKSRLTSLRRAVPAEPVARVSPVWRDALAERIALP